MIFPELVKRKGEKGIKRLDRKEEKLGNDRTSIGDKIERERHLIPFSFDDQIRSAVMSVCPRVTYVPSEGEETSVSQRNRRHA